MGREETAGPGGDGGCCKDTHHWCARGWLYDLEDQGLVTTASSVDQPARFSAAAARWQVGGRGGILLADGHAPPCLLVWTWRRRKLAFESGLMDCLVIPMLADASLCIGRKGCVGWKGKHVEGCWFKQHWYG